MTIERALKGANSDGKLLFLGVVARTMGCSEAKGNRGKYGATRSRQDSLGSGARNAMEKSVEHLGELGVTMIAGSGDFSSTKGMVRSIKKHETTPMRASVCRAKADLKVQE